MSQPLARALAEIGLEGTVEARGTLAVLRLPPDAELASAELRARCLALAREHGFTHLALELVGAPAGDAPFHRD